MSIRELLQAFNIKQKLRTIIFANINSVPYEYNPKSKQLIVKDGPFAYHQADSAESQTFGDAIVGTFSIKSDINKTMVEMHIIVKEEK